MFLNTQKMLKRALLQLLVLFPIFISSFNISYAARANDLQDYIVIFMNFINKVLIPVLFSIAILFFFINITRYFIFKGSDSYSHEQARKYALYSIIAFVIIVGIWGIVALVMDALDITNTYAICPDYNPGCNGQFGPWEY